MREITAGKLSKILKEHKRWRDTDEEEGEKSDLSHANLSEANLSGADLRNADLIYANLRNANLRNANLSFANLERATLSAADLSQADLSRTDLSDADLSRAYLSGARLRNANLSDANLRKADLYKANLSFANLERATLSAADLSRADLYYANLRGADLYKADLSGASLFCANLNYADLRGTDLSESDLSGANLIRVRGLTIEQLSSVETLCDAELSSELMEQVKDKYPHLLGEIEPDEEELSKSKIITLRSSYKKLSVSEVQSMPNVTIHEKDEDCFGNPRLICHSTINHDYNPKTVGGDKVVVDNATGLMWHQGGSGRHLTWADAKEWIKKRNKNGYAGYHDWRLPTVDEAVSLLESGKKNGNLYIDPVFSKKQRWIWTGDSKAGSEAAWRVGFSIGGVYWNRSIVDRSVRPVRSVE